MPSASVVSTSLRGAEGASWFRHRGVEVVDAEGLQLYANEIHDANTRLTRVWHSRIDIDVHIGSRDSSIVLIQIEGVALLEMEGEGSVRELHPGGFALFPAGTTFSMRSTGEVARYEASFDLGNLPPAFRERVASGLVENEPLPGYRQLVVGAASSALTFELASAQPGFAFFLHGFTSFVTALIVQTLEDRAVKSGRGASLYDLALRVIERESKDPDFAVTELADAVGVSLRHLRRVFAEHGTTPTSALRDERLRTAYGLLSAPAGGARVSREAIAHLSGFRDARTLRRALDLSAGERGRGSGGGASDW
ncbi:helix-turn-helix domain-containing protein [Rathayibacter sp. VKM Ac-2759]|uniref:helix-turn-helix transcriptional regulator n=1 Tax=Rathayibacter sp. VKM Ac-2759 TaxID=2609252 RepID=UPI001315D8E5|nr:helix-turn-helix domain-containing protein [Rathayibacter sp. VKM Ac-2759]QHC68268.1 helix-turn-helix domain-containing protein [Rathayibacter sp. VKM Ac-2759]